MLQEVLGRDVNVPVTEVVIGHMGQVEHALSWHWRLPDDTPEELRHKLSTRAAPQNGAGEMAEVAAAHFRRPHGRAGRYRTAVPQSAVWPQSGCCNWPTSIPIAETYNQLRRKLELAGTDRSSIPAGLDLNRIPLSRIARLRVESLTDEQLKQAFNRAVVANFSLALKRLAPEVLKRPELAGRRIQACRVSSAGAAGSQRRRIAAFDR